MHEKVMEQVRTDVRTNGGRLGKGSPEPPFPGQDPAVAPPGINRRPAHPGCETGSRAAARPTLAPDGWCTMAG